MTINILYAFWILELYLFGLAFGFLISTLFLCFWYFIFHLCSFFLHHRIFFLWWSKFQQYYNTCIIVKKNLLQDFIPWKNEINNNAEEYIEFSFVRGYCKCSIHTVVKHLHLHHLVSLQRFLPQETWVLEEWFVWVQIPGPSNQWMQGQALEI